MENYEVKVQCDDMLPEKTNTRTTNLYDNILSETKGFFEKPFNQELTGQLCNILLRTEQKAEAEKVGFSIHNPFRVTLNGGDVYEIYFKDYEYVEDKKIYTIPQGAVYKIYDYGQERVW